MTAIVAIAEKGKVWVGGDSAGVESSYRLVLRKDEKVFINGDLIFGFTSSFRMGQLLRYSFKPPEHPAGISNREFMHTVFINAVRECLKSGGYAKLESGQESGGTFIVGYKGSLYCVHSDFQVAEPRDNFACVGCGDELCLGSLCSTKGKPEVRIRTALRIAERYSAGVRGPFVIKRL